ESRAGKRGFGVARALRYCLTRIFEEALMTATPVLAKERVMAIQLPPQRDERRTEALKTALAQIEKQFGKGSIMRLGGDAKMDIEGITTGSLGLDLAL